MFFRNEKLKKRRRSGTLKEVEKVRKDKRRRDIHTSMGGVVHYPKKEESESENEQENDPFDLLDEEEVDEIQVDFELFDLSEEDYHIAKLFLSSYLDGSFCTELVDFLVKEENIGTSIRVDQNCFGFISMVNLFHPRTSFLNASFKAIIDFVFKMLGKEKEKKLLATQILHPTDKTKANVGLIFNERVENCPEELALPLHENFWEEVDYILGNSEREESERNYFDCDVFLMISKVANKEFISPMSPSYSAKRNRPTEISYLKMEDAAYAVCFSNFLRFRDQQSIYRHEMMPTPIYNATPTTQHTFCNHNNASVFG